MVQALLAILLVVAPDPSYRSRAWRVVDTYGTGEACDLACSPWLVDADRDTTCINAALEHGLTDERYNAVELPPGNCYINDRLDILSVRGVSVYGHGPHRTLLIWDSATPADPVLYLGDVSESHFYDFSIQPDSTRTITVAVELDNCAACAFAGESNVGHLPSKNRFERIEIGAPAGDQTLVDGFVVETDTDAANNEFHSFRDVLVQRHHGDAWRLESGQHKTALFDQCLCLSDTAFVETTACVRSSACFTWTGGGGGYHDFDFYMPSTGCQTTISGANFEGSHKFIYHGGNNGNFSGLIIQGVRWASEGVNVAAAGADRHVIHTGYSGGVVILASSFGTPSDVRPMAINIEGSGAAPFAMVATAFNTSLTAATDVFPSGQPTLFSGTVNRVGGVNVQHAQKVWSTTSGATPFVKPGYVADWGIVDINNGTTTITDFISGYDGQTIIVWANGSAGRTITHGANIDLAGDESVTMAGDDVLVLQQIAGTWTEIGRATSGWSGATVRASTSVATDLITEFTAAAGVAVQHAVFTGTSAATSTLAVSGVTADDSGTVFMSLDGAGDDILLQSDTLRFSGSQFEVDGIVEFTSGAGVLLEAIRIENEGSNVYAFDVGSATSTLNIMGNGDTTSPYALTVNAYGDLAVYGAVTYTAGASANLFKPVLALDVAYVNLATTGTVQETLYTYTLPANVLNADGRWLRIHSVWSTAANANAKTFLIHFGGTTVCGAAVGTNAGLLQCDVDIVRTGASAQVYSANAWANGVDAYPRPTTSLTKTDTNTIAIDFIGTTATSAGDLTLKSVLIELIQE